ncbi:ABC transporter ATP-binding protein [Paenibacillus sp. FSL H8-0548]|uniref:ABC transporter ATP-binding protein n=1 Tax=Paenibacillus sp. FSL H8-0548 TaxID=1920422 RepID=UPI00096BDFF4|nr:ABC transporter ATP-binding protein [Paenibacillus sp. FSL H8-0548]OMF25830.1 ABC transporter ATP-binding protein [Paenibacillus sp. FSL H8-0548]
MIQLNELTKTFKNGRGIFQLNFVVKRGEVFGFLGPNGAGKSTTIRHLMGFIKPESGNAEINGLDCWRKSAEIQLHVGYLPGEIAFPEGLNGYQLLKMLAGMRGMKDYGTSLDLLIERLQFDVRTPFRKMSKGMKQKVGIVATFMHDPSVLILDEPTSGLDPLMQNVFIELVKEAKDAGKTVIMSSHSFEEINRTCDRAGIIKDGRIIAIEDVQQLQTMQRKMIDLTLATKQDITVIRESNLEIVDEEGLTIKVALQGNYDEFIQTLSKCKVKNMDIHAQKLEDIFMHYYVQKERMG